MRGFRGFGTNTAAMFLIGIPMSTIWLSIFDALEKHMFDNTGIKILLFVVTGGLAFIFTMLLILEVFLLVVLTKKCFGEPPGDRMKGRSWNTYADEHAVKKRPQDPTPPTLPEN